MSNSPREAIETTETDTSVDSELCFTDTSKQSNRALAKQNARASSVGVKTRVVVWRDQLRAMLIRHMLNVVRNKARTITPIFISLLLFALFVGFAKFGGTTYEKRGKLSDECSSHKAFTRLQISACRASKRSPCRSQSHKLQQQKLAFRLSLAK